MESKDGWPEFNLLPNPFRRVGAAINYFFNMTQLSPVSEHFQHPLDDTFSMERERVIGGKVLRGEMSAFEGYCEVNNGQGELNLWEGSGLPPAA
jgi:hypothetical protein